MPASNTPNIIDATLFLKSILSIDAASVPVQAPVPGRGIPTNNNNAIYVP